MSRISRVFRSTHFVDYITTAAPGLKDILVLGKVWYLEQDRDHGGGAHGFDTIIVDAPAAGHMATFLRAPQGLADAVRLGPVRRQSEWLNDMLTDPKRSRVHLVSLAEEMPVSETLETSGALVKDLGISQGALFANGIYSRLLMDEEADEFERVAADGKIDELWDVAKASGINLDDDDLGALHGYAHFLKVRRSIQSLHLKKLRRGATQPVIELPFLFSAGLALPDIETLADVIEEQVETL